jgi:acyl-CoA dehydrogenase
MFELDLDVAVSRYGPEWAKAAAWYRSNSLAVLDDPDVVLGQLDTPLLPWIISQQQDADARRRALISEALAYGDCGFLLTMPGPSLSGVLVNILGDEEQRTFFREQMTTRPCRTFFAVTEPDHGSDAARMQTRLSAGGVLSGQKMLFGNGAVAEMGTVLARTGDGPLDVAAVLLTRELVQSVALERESLDMFAMRGAQLSRMTMHGVEVPEHLVLGRHLSPAERGMMGLIKTFHRFRPGVSAMAIGHTQAVLDYTRKHFTGLRESLDGFDFRLARVRDLNLAAADQVDREPTMGSLVSLAKARAIALAEEVAAVLGRRLPVAALVEHPWLAKSLADVYAFDFMEGTTPIHLINVHSGYLRREISALPKEVTA